MITKFKDLHWTDVAFALAAAVVALGVTMAIGESPLWLTIVIGIFVLCTALVLAIRNHDNIDDIDRLYGVRAPYKEDEELPPEYHLKDDKDDD